MTVSIAAFYKFVWIADAPQLQSELMTLCVEHGVKGTILIALEGINGNVSASTDAIETFTSKLRADPRFTDLTVKTSTAAEHPFQRLKIKLKPEIVTFGVPEADPSKQVGTYVAPENWNALIRDPAVTVIDTRNTYEFATGTFDRAIDPGTAAFSQFPDFVKANLDPKTHPKIAIFCTGGIRCEKASAYMLATGFPEVYHLDGGILKYLETVPADDSLWRGDCFVFDERGAVEHGVKPGAHRLCETCGHPVSPSSACTQCAAA